jgi:hypothetical protein
LSKYLPKLGASNCLADTSAKGELKMLSLFVRLEAKPGKGEAVAAFMKQGLEMEKTQPTTLLWFALRLVHPRSPYSTRLPMRRAGKLIYGPIAKALMGTAPNLLAVPPSIEKAEILGAKTTQTKAA